MESKLKGDAINTNMMYVLSLRGRTIITDPTLEQTKTRTRFSMKEAIYPEIALIYLLAYILDLKITKFMI